MRRQYPSYKPSGIEWIGEIPEHWEVKRLRYLLLKDGLKIGPFGSSLKYEFVKDSGYKIFGQENVIKDDFTLGRKYLDEEKFSELSVYEIVPGDIVITMMGTTGKCKVVPKAIERGIMDSHLIRLRINRSKFLPNLLSRIINESHLIFSQLKWLSKGSIMEGLNSTIIKSLVIAVPPSQEQRMISDYLDKKTALIDETIQKKQRLIELLQEERTALVNRAVTKGLDDTAPLKPSGADWFGNIPEHWNITKLKYIFKTLESGVSVNSFDTPVQSEKEVGVLKTSCVYRFEFDPNENKTVVAEEIERVSIPVKKGTLIISRMNTPELVGACGIVTHSYNNLYLPDRLWQAVFIEPDDAILQWSYIYLTSPLVRGMIGCIATGTSSSMKNLSQNDLLSLPIPMPPKEELLNIVNWYVKFTEDQVMIKEKISQEISLLQEYRTALINEVVTGKVCVI